MKKLDEYIADISKVFRENQDRYKAHELSRPILAELGKDISFFHQIVDKSIARPGFFDQKRITPVVAFDIEVNEMYSLIAHCWLPQPDLDVEMTNQSIHHHGDLLLTSLAAFGPGYESILFKENFSFDKKTYEAKMEIDKIYKNPYMNIEFVEKYTPHVVFYPDSLSITYALWSNYKAKGTEKLRNSGFIQRNKKKLRKLIDQLNLASVLGLNPYQFVDFYPEDGKVYVMKDRIRYPVGSKKSFAFGFFNVLSGTGYNNFAHLESCISKEGDNVLYRNLLERFKGGESMEDFYEESHLNIPKVNIKKEEILKCF